jgi:hypothetical protein
MNKIISITVVVAAIFLLASQASAAPTWGKDPAAFEHGIALDIDGETWYFRGPGSVDPAAHDVPGHTWVQTGPYHVVGRHYNVGPFDAAGESWWAPGEPYGVLLFKVDGIIAPPPDDLDEKYADHLQKKGYVHVHELIDEDGMMSEEMAVYLKHTAVRHFYFDPQMPMPMQVDHEVTPGIDFEFMPNWP